MLGVGLSYVLALWECMANYLEVIRKSCMLSNYWHEHSLRTGGGIPSFSVWTVLFQSQ